jgi:alpha-D-ribose 1-methylphosphonate 5-triphosphate synthase subunit PhnG
MTDDREMDLLLRFGEQQALRILAEAQVRSLAARLAQLEAGPTDEMIDAAAIDVAWLLHKKAGGQEVTPHDIARAAIARATT